MSYFTRTDADVAEARAETNAELAELRTWHNDLIEALCALIPEDEMDDAAVESVIVEWVKRQRKERGKALLLAEELFHHAAAGTTPSPERLGELRTGLENLGVFDDGVDPVFPPAVRGPVTAIAARLGARHASDAQAALVNALVMAEEMGEAVQEIRRYLGYARRTSDLSDVGAEMADVVISTAVTAKLLGVDLGAAIVGKLSVIEQRGGV